MNLTTYLSFKGNCAEAFKFYEQATGGKINFIMTYGEAPLGSPTPPEMRDMVMHASMNIGGSELMGSDAFLQSTSSPEGFSVSINIENPDDADRIYAALSDGGTIKMPIGETFWAFRFGMLVDKFAIPWMINCEKPIN